MRTKFMHLRNLINGKPSSRGGITIAYVLNDDFNVIGFAPARCHINDNYSRKTGRIKAEGRLKSKSFFVQVKDIPEKEFHHKMVEMQKYLAGQNEPATLKKPDA